MRVTQNNTQAEGFHAERPTSLEAIVPKAPGLPKEKVESLELEEKDIG